MAILQKFNSRIVVRGSGACSHYIAVIVKESRQFYYGKPLFPEATFLSWPLPFTIKMKIGQTIGFHRTFAARVLS
jgi:hypothetical protein